MSHRLLGPRLKMQRAEREIERLRAEQHVFSRGADYQLVRAELNPKTGKFVYRLRGNASPDPEWGVWIGEIAHNLRSALDGLIYQLILIDGNEPTARTQFPIFHHRSGRPGSYNGFEGPGRGSGRDMLKGVHPKHQAMIERLQPYHGIRGLGANGRYRHPLWLLHEINNADKHRLLQVVGVKPGSFITSSWSEATGQDPAVTQLSGFRVLKEGDNFLEAAPDVHVNPKVTPLVAFWEGCPAVKDRSVVQALVLIEQHVSEIVERLAPEFG